MDMSMHRTARIRSTRLLSTIAIGEHVGVDVHFLLFRHHMVLVMVRLLVLARAPEPAEAEAPVGDSPRLW